MSDALPHSSTKEERTWAMAAHLTAFSTYIGLGFGGVLGPLIVWMIKKDSMPIVDDQGKEAMNFNISILIYELLCLPLFIVVIGVPLLIVVMIIHVIFTIVASVKAYDGELYRYPLTIRFIK